MENLLLKLPANEKASAGKALKEGAKKEKLLFFNPETVFLQSQSKRFYLTGERVLLGKTVQIICNDNVTFFPNVYN